MGDITCYNFKKELPKIEASVKKAKFLAIDLEFSGLTPLKNQQPSLFDNNDTRYYKLRKNLENVIPIQLGLTAFHYDSNNNNYRGDVFTFYLCPASFRPIDKAFYFQTATFNFLCLNDFDFDKFAYASIPYINSVEEKELRDLFNIDGFMTEDANIHRNYKDIIEHFTTIIDQWHLNSKPGDFLEIPEVNKKYKRLTELVYYLHKFFRNRYPNVWTSEENGCFCISVITEERRQKLERTEPSLELKFIEDLKGFSHVFNLIAALKKPLVGHNLVQDLMILVHNFEVPLPNSYWKFKKLIHSLFPAIYDTKTIFYELRGEIEKNKLPEDTSLKALFCYFKDGIGRHLILNTSAIDCNVDSKKVNKYHDGGWDSFCTGYIFLRMAHFKASLTNPKYKEFTSGQLIAELANYKNCVNLIRGATAHICLDKEDPKSNRPPWLLVESLKNKPLSIPQLNSVLSAYGFVNIRKIPFRRNQVLVAPDTYWTAKDILANLKTHQFFRAKQYNFWKHSHVIHAVILTISGTLLVWLSHEIGKK